MTEELQNVRAVLSKLREFEFKKETISKTPKPHNVLLRIAKVGICDVHYWAHGKCGPFEIKGPLVLGHETSGIVAAVGEGVTHLKVGDRVAIEPGIPCRYCDHCKHGDYHLCQKIEFLATPPYDGSLATYIEHAADFCFKLPDNLTLEEGALAEPLSVAIHACRRGAISIGSRVLVTGAGPIGLVNLLVAKAAGAVFVAVTDIKQDRLDIAKQLGADATILVDGDNAVQQVQSFGPFTHAIECSGAESSIQLGIKTVSPGGKVLLIGRSAKNNLSLPIFEAADKEIDLIGSFRYKNTYPTALSMMSSGKVNVKPLVTHHFNFDNTLQAFETAEVGKDGAIKVVIDVDV